MNLSVIYWNTAKNPEAIPIALGDRCEFDVIAIQEPSRNKETGRLYCPARGKYYLIYGGTGRAALYVHKRHSIASWSQDTGEDWCSVTFGSGQEAVTVWSIYSPCEEADWRSPLNELAERPPVGRHLLVGDMNLHHPLWDREGRVSSHADVLLSLAERWGLDLATPWGEPTRRRNTDRRDDRDGTIDHAWHTNTLRVSYEGPLDYAGSDHAAQLVKVVDLASAQRPRCAPRGWTWALMDKTLVQAEARNLHIGEQSDLNNPEALDRAVESLITQLHRIADLSTPRRKTNYGEGEPWWTREVDAAVKAASAAQRRYYAVPSPHTRDELQAAIRAQRSAIREARTRCWRLAVARASKTPKTLWGLQRWARLRSHAPQDPPTLPPLRDNEDAPQTAYSHSEKAEMLAARFFPNPEADLGDIEDTTWAETTSQQRFDIDKGIQVEEIEELIRQTGAWKAPGPGDNLPTGFLKACGRPLARILAMITQASFELEYFPQQFRSAGVVVLKKSGKTVKQQQTAGGWRPISLLSAVGKLIEAAIARRITDAAESQGLLPEGQMGNRKNRSTELAVRLVTEAVRTAWSYGAVASLLQLDIKGAFDTVNHIRLLDTMRKQGFPMWVVRWAGSYLEARTARLVFDDDESEPIALKAGVPQGSPLSPILFLLYIASLYEALERQGNLLIVGFADDTNIFVASRDIEANCRRLESAFRVCERWARTRGMEFAPQKSELMHFSRTHTAHSQGVRLAGKTITPVESARFLGVWLDRKLQWGRHLKEVKQKMATQKYALTKLAASAWGCSFDRARELYTKVIRSAIAYGASAWHEPGDKAPKGIARHLAATQSQCLRVVTGAYKATPIRHLETEAAIPPIDIYLNKRVAEFEARLDQSGMRQRIQGACEAVANRLRRQGRRRSRLVSTDLPRGSEARARWAREWCTEGAVSTPDEAVERDWKRRWERTSAARRAQEGRNTREPAETDPVFSGKQALKRHIGLKKHESSLLTQIRTGKVGLRAFLFQRRVPNVATPLCRCGNGEETPAHIAVFCPELEEERRELRAILAPQALLTTRDFAGATGDPARASAMVKWLLATGRFPEYRLARRYAEIQDHEDATAAPRELSAAPVRGH
jgi:Reverse transcriptase (RNA-dependent DNA polymerase)/Endonuclease-reverse transcriptase